MAKILKTARKIITDSPKIDLAKGLYFRVAGKEEETHKLSWETLKKIGDNTQKLINKLSKYSLCENPLDEDALKLEFIGFFPGSAIPAFDLTKPKNLLFAKTNAYNELNNDLSFVLGHLNDGNFQAIADKYSEPLVKNDIIETISEFSNSAGTKPFSIVKPSKNKFTSVLKIRNITPQHKALLLVPTPKEPPSLTYHEDIEGVSKILIKKGPKGRVTKKISHLYTQKEAVLSLKFDSIETDKRIYILRNELIVTFTESKKSFTIESQLLDIYAWGSSVDEAEKDLFDQFDYTFQRLNQFEDNKLSKHLLNAKTYINLIVENVKVK